MESYFAPFPVEQRSALVNFVRGTMKQLRFGAPADANAPAENMGGHLVPIVTSATLNAEVAVEHRLDRVPRLLIPVLRLSTVNATIPELTVTKAADSRYIYVSSPIASASVWCYVE